MGPEILHALLWSVRTTVRCNRTPTLAGHGYADPGYRPPRLPYISLVGPISIEAEPQRDVAEARRRRIQTPGYIVGDSREPDFCVRGGSLSLRLDQTDTIDVQNVPATTLDGADSGEVLAARLEDILRKAALVKQNLTEERKAELGGIWVRWDKKTRRFAIGSGRRGIVEGEPKPSSVEVLAAQNASSAQLAEDLGLLSGKNQPGRLLAASIEPRPQAMVVHVRLDLWASSQLDLAALLDGLNRWVRGRGSLLVMPALLAEDVPEKSTRIPLLPNGEPTHRFSLAHLEAADSFVDRAADVPFHATGDVTRENGRFRFGTSGGTIRGVVCPTPFILPAFDAEPIAPRGFALAVGFALLSPGRPGDRICLAELNRDGRALLTLEVTFVAVNGHVEAEITATAAVSMGTDNLAMASLRWSVERLSSLCIAHAVFLPALGWVELSLRDPEGKGDTAIGSAGQSSTSLAGYEMTLVLGGNQTIPFEISFVHLFGEPLGPFDVRLRRGVLGANRWPVGRRIQLAESDGGLTLSGKRFEATVVAVHGDALEITPAVVENWKRGSTIVFADEAFIQQTELRRKDDLAGKTFRASVDYRISAVLEDEAQASTTPLVLEITVEERARGGASALGLSE